VKLLQAIAKSSGNKAEGLNDKGKTVVVQERYTSLTDRWYHAWLLAKDELFESDIPPGQLEKLGIYDIDPNETYWFPVDK
jgi:hypothetical protein